MTVSEDLGCRTFAEAVAQSPDGTTTAGRQDREGQGGVAFATGLRYRSEVTMTRRRFTPALVTGPVRERGLALYRLYPMR